MDVPYYSLKDDEELLKQLEGDSEIIPSCRLLFLWSLLSTWFAVEVEVEDEDRIWTILLKVIRGNNEDLDAWLWVDGDEEWKTGLYPRKNSPLYLSMSNESRRDVAQALRQRMHSSQSHHSLETVARQRRVRETSDRQTRFTAIRWIIAMSNAVADRQVREGRRPMRTFQLLHHIRFDQQPLTGVYPPCQTTLSGFRWEMNRRHHKCHNYRLPGETLECWHAFMLWFYDKGELGVICLDRSKCSHIDYTPPSWFNFPDDFQHITQVVKGRIYLDSRDREHPDESSALLAILADKFSDEYREHELVLAGFWVDRLTELFTPDSWDTFNNQLSQHLRATVEPPSIQYLAWINLYPEKWRDRLVCPRTTQCWEKIRDMMTDKLPRPSPGTNSLSSSTNLHIHVGVVVWAVCKGYADEDFRWFKAILTVLGAFRGLQEVDETPMIANLLRCIVESGHTCHLSREKSLLVLYASVMIFVKKSEGFKFSGIADPDDEEVTCKSCKKRFGRNDTPAIYRGTSPVNEVHTGDSNLRSVVPESSNTDLTPTLDVGVPTSAPIPSAVYDPNPYNDINLPIEGEVDLIQEPFQGQWDRLVGHSFAPAFRPPLSEVHHHVPSSGFDLGWDNSQMNIDNTSIFGSIAPMNVQGLHPMIIAPVPTEGHDTINQSESAKLALTRFLDIIRGPGVDPIVRGDLLALARRELDVVQGNASTDHDSEQCQALPPPSAGPSQEQTMNLEPSFVTFPLVGSDVAPRITQRERDKRVLAIKEYLLSKLVETGVHVSKLPWSKLHALVIKRGYEIVNWPEGVLPPFIEKKGINGRPNEDIDLLYAAITNPDESCRLTFLPIPSVASGSGVQSMPSKPDELSGATGVVTMR
ncbi:hypothetical protein JAAARDRAFT_212031, partial [Jaapia argillacea MUCL 33604]